MTALRAILAAAALAWAFGAQAVPFHGCTFYQERLFGQTPACASLTVEPSSCPKVNCTPIGCWEHQGVKVTGWMPDHFIEVTNRAGESAFASLDAPAQVGQMADAMANWLAHQAIPVPDQLGAVHELAREGHAFSMFFGRTLRVPYAELGWKLKTTNWSAGTRAASCFSAITELVAETWSDTADSGDRELAAAWAAPGALVCEVGATVTGAIAQIPIPSAPPPSSSSCANAPLPAPVQKARALSAPGAYKPLKACMGALGGLYPRTGHTEGSTYTAAERVAWRTASLSEDVFGTGVGVRGDDRWQIVWPPTPNPRCFAPGSLFRPSPVDGSEAFFRTPEPDGISSYDSPLTGSLPATEYVFAVWRRRESCLNAWEFPDVEAEVLKYFPFHYLECIPQNAVMRGP